jgi:hypothetical protein
MRRKEKKTIMKSIIQPPDILDVQNKKTTMRETISVRLFHIEFTKNKRRKIFNYLS